VIKVNYRGGGPSIPGRRLHGHAALDATSFSQPIGLGATFDPELAERLFTMTAKEARMRGAHQALTPVVDVAREPRASCT